MSSTIGINKTSRVWEPDTSGSCARSCVLLWTAALVVLRPAVKGGYDVTVIIGFEIQYDCYLVQEK